MNNRIKNALKAKSVHSSKIKSKFLVTLLLFFCPAEIVEVIDVCLIRSYAYTVSIIIHRIFFKHLSSPRNCKSIFSVLNKYGGLTGSLNNQNRLNVIANLRLNLKCGSLQSLENLKSVDGAHQSMIQAHA